MGDMQQFLEEFYDIDGQYLMLWTLPDKKSKFFTDVEAAQAFANDVKKEKQVYIGVGLAEKEFKEHQRAKKADIVGIPGFWIDIDIKSAAHKNTMLPTTTEEALKVAHLIPEMPPTVVVHTGNGIQAWWAFKEIWLFDDEEERLEAEEYAKRFIYTFDLQAQDRFGWKVDKTIDLPRIMRLPGTYNLKDPDNIKPVEIIRSDYSRRYDPSEIEQYLVDLSSIPTTTSKELADANFIINLNAQPNMDKFQAIEDLDESFKDTFDGGPASRKRLNNDDSSYDLSLATTAFLYDWSDQEIVNLIIAGRRRRKADLKKLERVDYLARTIARAKNVKAKQDSEKVFEDFSDLKEMGEVATSSEVENKRQEYLDALSAKLGFDIVRIIQYKSDTSVFHLELKNTIHPLGEVQNLIEQNLFRRKIADAERHLIPKMKGPKWDQIAQMMLNVVEERDIGDDATESNVFKMMLKEYLDSNPPHDVNKEDSPEHTLYEYSQSKDPFLFNKEQHFFPAKFQTFLRTTLQERMTIKQIAQKLTMIGIENKQMNTKKEDGSRSSMKVRRIPHGLL